MARENHSFQKSFFQILLQVRSEYVKTLSRVFSQHFKSYLSDIEKMHMAVATKNDVLGSDEAQVGGGISAFFTQQKGAQRENNVSI